MSAVLEPLLGFELARERANNIAQVLLFCGVEGRDAEVEARGSAREQSLGARAGARGHEHAVGVACSMLKGTGLADPVQVAEQVASAWRAGVLAMEQIEARAAAHEQVQVA
jgi:hypothetical protein